jgi:hypothetical protein
MSPFYGCFTGSWDGPKIMAAESLKSRAKGISPAKYGFMWYTNDQF